MAGERTHSLPPMTPGMFWGDDSPTTPYIGDHDSFSEVLRKLNPFFTEAIKTPQTFEELSSPAVAQRLDPLINYCSDSVHNRTIVCALLALKSHFTAIETDDWRGVNITRGLACEYVAWRLVTQLSAKERIDYLLYELPPSLYQSNEGPHDEEAARGTSEADDRSDTALLSSQATLEHAEGIEESEQNGSLEASGGQNTQESDDFASLFDNLNALEIAAVSDAKSFLSKRVVQRMIESIWRGDIVFWESLGVDSTKEAKIYNKKKADPFTRLRVPRYLKVFEAIFFITFLAVYLAVLIPIQRNAPHRPRFGAPPLLGNDTPSSWTTGPIHNFHNITPAEILLYIFIAAFAYDEFGEYRDAGRLFYQADFWSLFDIGIVAIGLAFFVTRLVGLYKASDDIIGAAFDILALEALFLVPRLCSILSLNPYFGTLIPCLREMTKDFLKFLSLVIILYLGFLTTFTLLARDNFSLRDMFWILTKIFFGSSYLGFDIAKDISPVIGPPLMLIFICLTNILLITSLISLLSNSLTRILDQARPEYLYIYSVYVLEASTSNRLTYFLPPMNLIPLLMRPLRLVVSTEQLRKARIVLLKITHAPYIAAIFAFEALQEYLPGSSVPGSGSSLGGPSEGLPNNMKRASYLRSLTVMASVSQSSLPRPSRGVGRSRPATAATGLSVDPQEELKALVLRLSNKVDELAAIVAEKRTE